MGINRLKEKLEEQQEVYASLKQGNSAIVCYKEFQNGKWGTDDANYTNRLRLAYYLLYWNIEDEETIAYLFREELKDRERNSFQGIGSTIEILTWLLRKYNTDHTYDDLFQRAKNANFDCACGYDVEVALEDDFEKNDLLDCIYLCQQLEYKDVMGGLVDEWKQEMGELACWNTSERQTLIRFNTFLDRERENEELYQLQLTEVLSEGTNRTTDIISGYSNLIHHYLRMGNYEKAFDHCRMVVEKTDYKQIRTKRLFGDILEGCLEIVVHDPSRAACLWEWVKKELRGKPRICRYGNLYTKGIAAAKAVNDSYAEALEQEYRKWRRECGLGNGV